MYRGLPVGWHPHNVLLRLRSRSPRFRDPLTGLPNHHGLYRALRQLAIRRRAVALVIFDVDQMRHINSHLGHSRGDNILRDIASRLDGSARSRGGMLYRIGGDEFAAVLPSTTAAVATAWAEDVCNGLMQDVIREHNVGVAPVTLHAGVAAAPRGKRSISRRALEQFVMSADAAYTWAGETGRGCVRGADDLSAR